MRYITAKTTAFGAVAALLALTACSGDEGGSDDGAGGDGERHSLTMGMAHTDTYTAGWWGWLAAEQLGYYDELGLDVEFVAAGGSGAAIEQVIAGNVDAGNPSAPAFGEAALVDMPVVDIFSYANGAIFGIFAPKDGGIESLEDLRGKNIGISEPGGGEVAFLEAALRSVDIDPITEVQMVPVGEGGPETLAALENGRIDAYSTAYNDIYAVQTAGVYLNDLTPAIYDSFPARGIITTRDSLESNGEALKRFTRGTAMGIYFCTENMDACLDMMKGAIPATFEENADGISQGELRFEMSVKQVTPVDIDNIGKHDPEGTQEFLDLIRSTSEEYREKSAEDVLSDDFLDYANDFDHDAVAQDAADYEMQNG